MLMLIRNSSSSIGRRLHSYREPIPKTLFRELVLSFNRTPLCLLMGQLLHLFQAQTLSVLMTTVTAGAMPKSTWQTSTGPPLVMLGRLLAPSPMLAGLLLTRLSFDAP